MKDYLLLKTTLVGRQSSILDILCWNTNFGQTTETGTLTINYHHRCKRKVKSWFLLEQSFKSRKRLFARGPLSNKSSFAVPLQQIKSYLLETLRQINLFQDLKLTGMFPRRKFEIMSTSIGHSCSVALVAV